MDQSNAPAPKKSAERNRITIGPHTEHAAAGLLYEMRGFGQAAALRGYDVMR